jgi:hypothetical protein
MRKESSRRYPNLERLLRSSPVVELAPDSSVVVFSDLHLGDGGRGDEFLHNADIFRSVLEGHYLERRFGLVLNGDIEELMKFSCRSICGAWGDLYELFSRFGREGRFWKIYGNHDLGLLEEEGYPLAPWLAESLVFRYGTDAMLLFHGHQASPFLNSSGSVFSRALSFLLRYLAKPAGIRNYSVSYDSRKRYAIEQAVYDFSNSYGIISMIGHTHRPLFESLSKVDHLNYRIEELCRSYPSAGEERRLEIESQVGILKEELDACYRKGSRKSLWSGRYGNITIPSIFNSGCAIGKRGITAIEIESGMIRLVYWQRSQDEARPSGIDKVVLNEDRLDYVFARIRLLTRDLRITGHAMSIPGGAGGRQSPEFLSSSQSFRYACEAEESGLAAVSGAR